MKWDWDTFFQSTSENKSTAAAAFTSSSQMWELKWSTEEQEAWWAQSLTCGHLSTTLTLTLKPETLHFFNETFCPNYLSGEWNIQEWKMISYRSDAFPDWVLKSKWAEMIFGSTLTSGGRIINYKNMMFSSATHGHMRRNNIFIVYGK